MNLSTFYYHLQRGYFGKRATLSASYWVNVAALFLISLGDVDVDFFFLHNFQIWVQNFYCGNWTYRRKFHNFIGLI